MPRTLLEPQSRTLYEPYFAECPGLSARLSPPKFRGTPFALTILSISPWCCFHTDFSVGCRCFAWFRKNVCSVMEAQENVFSARKNCVGDPPTKSIEAERWRFPTGCLPSIGWLCHVLLWPHEMHDCITLRLVPVIWPCSHTDWQHNWHNVVEVKWELSSTQWTLPPCLFQCLLQ